MGDLGDEVDGMKGDTIMLLNGDESRPQDGVCDCWVETTTSLATGS